ncbi:MAG: Ku protein [Bacilli bacterium]|nr:Ku protein [Bacilli bacterium]
MKKTSISFGLVNIPVQINPIIKNNDISFNQLHKKCGSRIKYVKYCPHCKKEVKQTDIVKGYEYEDNEYITLTNEEFDNLKSEDEKTIEVVGFVDLKEIDPVYFEKSYVVETNSKSKAYTLFKDALLKTKKVALAKTVIGTKFYYVILRLSENMIVMNTLYFFEEVNMPDAATDTKYTKKELDLAIELVNSLNMKFKPEELEDEYQNKIKDAIDLKIEGKNIKKPKKKRETNIKDLMTALEMSLKNV